jgi:hypothetical protein
MNHLKTDYEAITKGIEGNPFDSEEAFRRQFLELTEFVMAFSAELEKRDRKIAELRELVAEIGDDVDTILDSAQNYLDLETGSRVVDALQGGMGLLAGLVKLLEDEFQIDDIRKQSIRSTVEPYLQSTAALLEELADIIDKEEDDDGEPADGDDGDGDTGDSDSDDGASGDGDEEEEGATEEGA